MIGTPEAECSRVNSTTLQENCRGQAETGMTAKKTFVRCVGFSSKHLPGFTATGLEILLQCFPSTRSYDVM